MNPRQLLRLYPRAWRERYGDEFLALVESERLRPRLVLDVLCAAAGEWTFAWLRLDHLGMLRKGAAIVCGTHIAAWGWACLEGWALGPSLTAHPEWWTLEALEISASLQLSSALLASVCGLGLPLMFAKSLYKTREKVLDWLVFVTVMSVAIARAMFLDVGPSYLAVTTLLGDHNATALMIGPAVLVADWARAVGHRRLEQDGAPQPLGT